jgi:hypothetical protein
VILEKSSREGPAGPGNPVYNFLSVQIEFEYKLSRKLFIVVHQYFRKDCHALAEKSVRVQYVNFLQTSDAEPEPQEPHNLSEAVVAKQTICFCFFEF